MTDSMECGCSLRNVHDLLADGKTPYERTIRRAFNGPVIPFGAVVEYHPISTRDQNRRHQYGKKVLAGIFLGYALLAGENLERDILIGDVEELETQTFFHDGSMRKKCLSHKREKNSFSHLQMVQQNCLEEPTNSENPFKGENILCGVKISVEAFKTNRKSLDQQNQKMTLKPGMTSGQFKFTSFIVSILNLELNSSCRRKKHSLFH